jgi:2-polyprenyl-3-methyl-5-hydroxy-6-metoxy-1,4-benzoquinol methylase
MVSSSIQSAEPNPQLIWDTFNAYQRTAALRAAIDLDLFSAVGGGRMAATEIAKRCRASERGIRILCDYLTIIGFLFKEAEHYSLTPTSAAFLDQSSPACMCSTVHFLNSPELMSGFENLAENVRRGGTVLPCEGFIQSDFDAWVTFAESMKPLMGPAARFIADEAVREQPSPKRVLDIAAGHGLFGITLGQTAPQAEIVAQDWPNVLKLAESNARSAGIEGRYKLLPGNAFTVDFGTGYDVVLLTNLLHHFDQPACASLLKKVHGCLASGGQLFTLEFVPNEDRITPPIPASFSLMMLGTTPAGDAYTGNQWKDMLSEAGFARNRLEQVPQSPQQLIVSTK